jgi:hypothetical protein
MSIEITKKPDGWELTCDGTRVWNVINYGTPSSSDEGLFPTREAAVKRVSDSRRDKLKMLSFVMKHRLWGKS